MTRASAAAALAILFFLVTTLSGLPASAQRQDLPTPTPLLRVDVTSMSPRLVSAADEQLRVTARVTNIATVPVQNLNARLQLGARQSSGTELRQALRGTAPYDAQMTPFQQFSPVLQPGEATDLTLVADLRGAAGGMLFAEPGVYPLLVNVNGTPQD
ncbi:MAG: DUF6049 family protein, partial [Thermocrispum sp.]